jgi:AmmeMemoRadiSam system protein B
VTDDYRDSPLAGRFFPSDAGELRGLIDRWLSGKATGEGVRALVVPHAALGWSGPTAAVAYARVRGSAAQRVLLVGPSHFVRFAGVAVAPWSGYRTPLGETRVDRAACERLLRRGPPFVDRPEAHADEHALEVQLPFLQRCLPEAELVPLLCGAELQREDLEAAAVGLRELVSDQTLVIASSDFTHYGASFGYTPFPVELAREGIGRLDEGALAAVRSGGADAFLEYVRQTRITICGRLAIALVLRMLAGQVSFELLEYTRSADRMGDYSQSVSYAAIVGRHCSGGGAGV